MTTKAHIKLLTESLEQVDYALSGTPNSRMLQNSELCWIQSGLGILNQPSTIPTTSMPCFLGLVNISVTAEAEENHELCGNQISVTPTRGQSDMVVKSLLVKVSMSNTLACDSPSCL